MTRSLGVPELSHTPTPLPPHTIAKVLQRWHTAHLQVNQRPFYHLKLPASMIYQSQKLLCHFYHHLHMSKQFPDDCVRLFTRAVCAALCLCALKTQPSLMQESDGQMDRHTLVSHHCVVLSWLSADPAVALPETLRWLMLESPASYWLTW